VEEISDRAAGESSGVSLKTLIPGNKASRGRAVLKTLNVNQHSGDPLWELYGALRALEKGLSTAEASAA